MSIQPAERKLRFSIAPNSYAVIDTAWALSQINRRSYRQGMEYAYDKVELFQIQPSSAAEVTILRLPHGWVTANAWTKAYHAWKKQRDDALEASDTWDMRAKYSDFKVLYNYGHATGNWAGGTTNVFLPTPYGAFDLADAQAIDADAGGQEWQYSEFITPAGASGSNAYLGMMLGHNAGTAKGLIQAYAESRARPHPEDPSTVDPGTETPGGLYAEMQPYPYDQMEEVMDATTERNDSPPYVVGGTNSEYEFYLGGGQSPHTNYAGQHQDRLICTASSMLTTDATGPFTAYCGLLWIASESEDAVTVEVTVAAGNYRGVAARPMEDVN